MEPSHVGRPPPQRKAVKEPRARRKKQRVTHQPSSDSSLDDSLQPSSHNRRQQSSRPTLSRLLSLGSSVDTQSEVVTTVTTFRHVDQRSEVADDTSACSVQRQSTLTHDHHFRTHKQKKRKKKHRKSVLEGSSEGTASVSGSQQERRLSSHTSKSDR